MSADVEAVREEGHVYMAIECKSSTKDIVRVRQKQLLKLWETVGFVSHMQVAESQIAAVALRFTRKRRDWIFYKLQPEDWMKPYLVFDSTMQSNFDVENPGASNLPKDKPPLVTNPNRIGRAMQVAALEEQLKVKKQELLVLNGILGEKEKEIQELRKEKPRSLGWLDHIETLPPSLQERAKRIKEDVEAMLPYIRKGT